MPDNSQSYLILFDGVCNLCNGLVNFIIKRDKKGRFKFASLQSNVAKEKLSNTAINAGDLETLVLLQGNKVYTQSTAALRIALHLNGAWPLFYGFIIVPPFIRNGIYKIIARNRYRWFGKREVCRLPGEEEKGRFVL